MPPCATCGRVYFVDPRGSCRGCVALRRLSGELRFVPINEVDASLTVYLLETCLDTVEYLRDIAHAQADRSEQERQGRPASGLGLTSNRRSERGERDSQHWGNLSHQPACRGCQGRRSRTAREA